MNLITEGWQLGVILLLVLANGFFVASEFAIVKVRATQLKTLLKSKDWRVPMALRVKTHLYAYLSATQLGITLSSLGLGWLGQAYVSHWLEPLLLWIGITNPNVLMTLSLVLSLAFITFLHIVLGELAPKSIAIQHPKQVSLWFAPILVVFYYLFYPFIRLLYGMANTTLKWIGLKPKGEGEHAFSLEELQQVLTASRPSHAHDEMINKIMIKALRLKETTAIQIMISREKMIVLWREKSLDENLQIAQQTGFSRLPLCGQSLDEVLGVIHIKELLWQWKALGGQTDLATLAHPTVVFNAGTKLPTMLELFRNSRSHLAIVLDEEKRLLGIVSFEDVLEELVGDIRDEFDIEKGPFYEIKPHYVVVDAELPLRDLALETGWPLPTHNNETVGQWCLARWGQLPARGDYIKIEPFAVTAEQVGLRGLRRVRIEHLQQAPSEEVQTTEPGMM